MNDAERRLMLALVDSRLLFLASEHPEELLAQIARDFRSLVVAKALFN